MIIRRPDSIRICKNSAEAYNGEVTALCTQTKDGLLLQVQTALPLSYIRLTWVLTEEEKRKEPVRVLGDAWERGYGDLQWLSPDKDRVLPWYAAVSNGSDAEENTAGRKTECFGVKVRPSAFCSWRYDGERLELIADVRCGAAPVYLEGRLLTVCEILFAEYTDMSAFHAVQQFCGAMCTDCLPERETVFGSNNWYYAYGNSSREDILRDTALIADVCRDSPVRPFMVIDDGWSPNRTDAPWVPNEKFGDMRTLAEEMERAGVVPGIWIRYLSDELRQSGLPDSVRSQLNPDHFDPSCPEVLDYVRACTETVIGWGYRLIKHDFSTFDICGQWGREMGDKPIAEGTWSFQNTHKTTAEIILAFYTVIHDTCHAAGRAVAVIGCNTVSHLCAGLVEGNRTGDDTSGRKWSQTVRMGINTLAFRLAQNNRFYLADADCVGITEAIAWEKNRQWLDLLARSGSPLFVSCTPSECKGETRSDLQTAFREAVRHTDRMEPLDWMENPYPEHYRIDGKTVTYHW